MKSPQKKINQFPPHLPKVELIHNWFFCFRIIPLVMLTSYKTFIRLAEIVSEFQVLLVSCWVTSYLWYYIWMIKCDPKQLQKSAITWDSKKKIYHFEQKRVSIWVPIDDYTNTHRDSQNPKTIKTHKNTDNTITSITVWMNLRKLRFWTFWRCVQGDAWYVEKLEVSCVSTTPRNYWECCK